MYRIRLRIALSLIGLLGSPIEAQEMFFDSNGFKIRYTTEGQGQPALLIHGFGSSLERTWRKHGIIQALAEDYYVIALDLRGHGKSDKPHEVNQYGLELVEDIVRLLDHLKIEKAHIVGYSLGGNITVKLLTLHPDRLLTATLGGSAGFEKGHHFQAQETRAKNAEAKILPLGRPWGDNDPIALAALQRSLKALQVTNGQLKANRVPTLALYGSKETKSLLQNIEKLKQRMTNLQWQVIEGANHVNTVASPEFFKALRHFLKDHRKQKEETNRKSFD
jgi:pimeloyl-ACP methyl ester carboxylesterase